MAAPYITGQPLVLLHEALVVLVDLEDFADTVSSHLSLEI
jgi:hypothetical protein